ncbi:helix-turn-helix transcriptional regulator [Paraburkholderia adhaesiva]|uniref:helix-turn-helix transcriptional regulator n=1 Tax=Paraburkholderia adhaesiva TaxID=2883244 RepID=UPI001F175A7B|nr:LuxR family transcriptional regulator [Paraburkholderia adhaesiva]
MNAIENADVARALIECQDRSEWSSLLFELAGHYDFPSVFFAMTESLAATYRAAFVETNFPPGWWQAYEAERFSKIDPVLAHCRRHMHPLIWDAQTFVTERERAFYECGLQHGLASGIAYPVHGPLGAAGILCFASPDSTHATALANANACASLALVRDYVCESHRKIARSKRTTAETATLTPRELECLRWVAAGKTSWEMSRILSCSEATINFHISNITRKFGVQTRRQAAIRAISEGLVVPA